MSPRVQKPKFWCSKARTTSHLQRREHEFILSLLFVHWTHSQLDGATHIEQTASLRSSPITHAISSGNTCTDIPGAAITLMKRHVTWAPLLAQEGWVQCYWNTENNKKALLAIWLALHPVKLTPHNQPSLGIFSFSLNFFS